MLHHAWSCSRKDVVLTTAPNSQQQQRIDVHTLLLYLYADSPGALRLIYRPRQAPHESHHLYHECPLPRLS